MTSECSAQQRCSRTAWVWRRERRTLSRMVIDRSKCVVGNEEKRMDGIIESDRYDIKK